MLNTLDVDELMDLDTASKLLDCNKITLLRAIDKQELDAVRPGRKYLTTKHALTVWLQKKQEATQQSA